MIAKKRKKKKRNWDEILSISLLLGVNLIIIFFLIAGNWKIYQKRISVRKELIDLKREVASLEEINNQLRELFYQASQQEYLEKIIREKGLYKKPGEEVVVIIQEEKEKRFPLPPPPKEDVFQKLKNFFKNIFGE